MESGEQRRGHNRTRTAHFQFGAKILRVPATGEGDQAAHDPAVSSAATSACERDNEADCDGAQRDYEMQLLRNVLKFAHCWTGDLAGGYKPLRQVKSRVGECATKEQVMRIIETARANEYWQVAMWCAAVAIGTGCRGGEIRRLQLGDIDLQNGKLVIRREIAKNRKQREPRLMALAQWGLRHLLERAHALGATEPQHYLLPLQWMQSRYYHKGEDAKWDVSRPMFSWTRSWRKLVAECGMPGFRFHDLRHYAEFRNMPHQACTKLRSACKSTANPLPLAGAHAA